MHGEAAAGRRGRGGDLVAKETPLFQRKKEKPVSHIRGDAK